MKIDLKKNTSYKAVNKKYRVFSVPPMQYLMIDGHGDPNTSKDFVSAIETLYPVAYKLKFFSKIELKKDYIVPPLEGLWWANDMSAFSTKLDKSKWDWTLMILTPDWITQEIFQNIKEKLKENDPPKLLDHVRLETLDEGLCVQTLHIGPYDNEGPILMDMHEEFIPSQDLKPAKKHHEIYLSDFRRVTPDKLKTILRQPVEKI